MFFSNLTRRRLSSLLRPWLREEPELELSLGLVNSRAIAKNLRFDASALSELVDDGTGFRFADVTVGELIVRFSNWSVPAISFEVRGVNVTLLARDLKEESDSRPVRKRRDSFDDSMKKKLSQIDPEGIFLHNVLEKISATTPSENRFKTAFLNLVLKHCRLEVHNLNVQVRLPMLSDSCTCVLRLRELNVESQHLGFGCLLRGLVGSLFVPVKETSHAVSASGFEIVLKRVDQGDCVLLSADLNSSIRLKDLQPIGIDVRVPELSVSFSPADLSVCLALGKTSYKEEYQRARSGKQLWKLAARRIDHMMSSPGLKFRNLVLTVGLWLRYVNAYDYLLQLLGYSADNDLFKRTTTKISLNKRVLRSAKQCWKVISDIEEELPAESIAQARRIVRNRAAANVQPVVFKQSYLATCGKFIGKIFTLLGFIWKLTINLLHFITCLITFRWKLVEEPMSEDLEIACEDPSPEFCFILNLGRTIVNISPIYEVQLSEIKKLESHTGVPFSGFVSISLSVEAMLLKYVEDICEESLIVSCGQFTVGCPSLKETSLMQDSSKNFLRFAKGHSNGGMKSMLWCEPAQSFHLSETSKSSTVDNAKVTTDPLLEKFLQEMWLNWKRNCMKFEKSGILYSENPTVLYETRSFLKDPGLENSDSGLLKCFFSLGKIHLDLGCSSIVSVSVVLRQIQLALYWTGEIEESEVQSDTPRTTENPPETSWDGIYKFYASSVSQALLKMLPEKHIQVGVFMAGPCIKLSLEKEFSGGTKDARHMALHDGFHLGFDLENIEIASWPNLAFGLASDVEHPASDEAETEFTGLKQPQIVEMPKSENGKYTSNRWILLGSYVRISGVSAYLGSSADKQKSQIFVSQPMTLHFSSSREYFHSFSTNATALSAVLCASASGLTVLSYMDELHILSKVVINLCYAVSCVLSSFDPATSVSSEFFRQKFAPTKSENKKGTGEEAPSIGCSPLFLVGGIVKIKSVDLTLQKARIKGDMGNSTKISDSLSSESLPDVECPDCGILITLQQTSIDVSSEEEKLGISVEISEIQSVIFGHQNKKGKNIDQSAPRDLLLQSCDCLCEISLSNCLFSLTAFLPQNTSSSMSMHNTSWNNASFRNTDDQLGQSTSQINTTYMNNSIDSEMSISQTSHVAQNFSFNSILPAPEPTPLLLVDVGLGMIYLGSCTLKNALVGAHEVNKLLSSLSIGSDFQTISWEIQGGLVFLETQAMEKFICCFTSYLHSVTNILFDKQLLDEDVEKTEQNVDMTRIDDRYVSEDVDGTLQAHLEAAGEQMQALTINVSQLSSVLVSANKQGGVQEFVLEFDVRLNFELANMTRNIVFDLKRLSVLSQVLQRHSGNEFQLPHFYSFTSHNMSLQFESGDGPAELQPMDEIHPLKDPSSSRESDSFEKLSTKHSVPEVFDFICQKHILKHLHASLSVHKLVNGQAWLGNGSTSGLDIILSITEIEMILSIFSSFSGIASEMTTSDLDKKQRSSDLEVSDSSLEAMIPNGSIVAIQDVRQHVFFAIEGEENKYSLAGTIHYSLVGERALFRVKYHSQRRWGSSILWFSLISLHAKNNSGEPFRLNYRPGSGFVDISSNADGARASWRILSCEPESFESDIDWEPYNQLVRKNFYLVNKKNDCAVAFVDGVPEFVKKPGNPFKFKVFHGQSVARDFGNVDSHPLEELGTSLQHNTSFNGKASGQSGKFPCIDVAFDKISFTIVHELSDSSDVYPLLRASIDDTQLIVQVLAKKTRLISTLTASMYYFDSQRNAWTELLYPVEIFIFYRSKFRIQNSDAHHGIPVHIHCRTKEMNISLSELSLDILLFVIGNLNLAGPYSVKTSRILANCCKVENQTGTNLLCNFFNKQSVKVSRNQSTSIYLRYSGLTKQPLESAYVSIQLAVPGSFSTSFVRLSLFQSQKLAWRTRIMSSQDSRTYPGPFLIVDVSRESEDGLLVLVSPLIRIHNETRFSIELRFKRPQQKEDEFASAELKSGDTIDDSMAMFDALRLSGGLKKALTSLSLGNFLFSFRPNFTEILMNSKSSLSAEWSDDLEGGKAVHLSGIFDKLSYKVRKALLTEAVKCSFSTVRCSLKCEDSLVADMHFLIQSIGREVPVARPNNSKEGFEYGSSPVALQEQKEIFLLPTVKVSNLVQSEIHVILSETDDCSKIGRDNTLNQAEISSGCSVDFYVNPSIIYFTVTLTTYNSSCKQVNSGDLVKKLQKQKTKVQHLDIDLDFGGGSYFASLRLSRGHRGILEATVFTPYSLKNDTELYLYFFAFNRKPLPRHEVETFGAGPSELGLVLPPKSTRSWFLKSNKVRFKLLEDNASEALLDLDALSGLAEISLDIEESTGVKSITKLGVSMGPHSASKVAVSSQVVTMVPRYVLVNESDEAINIRQCYLQDDTAGITVVNSRQRKTLHFWNTMSKRREFSLFENFIRNHRKANDDALIHIQFRPNEPEFRWSGPVCIASLGRFFIKFRKQQSGQVIFAAVHVVEEGSTLVLHFHKPPNVSVPYRIENHLHDVSITYFQKESGEAEVLGSESSVDYIWDDITLPHRLVVRINDSHLLREINLDKVRGWKPFYKLGQRLGLTYHFLLDKNSEMKTPNVGEYDSMEMVKVGYQVYADGPTRVLRICEISNCHKGENEFHSYEKIQLRVPQFTIQLLQQETQDGNERGSSLYAPIIAARFGNISLYSLFTDQQKYNLISSQSLIIEQKWVGAPFAAMLRRHRVDNPESNDCILRIVFVLLSTTSDVIQFQYSSIALQPIELNLDEETLMKIVPFWRTSLADPNAKSRQYYFDQFEIQPIKIIANFLPGDSFSSYSSTQETLRSLLHSVIKVPPIKNMVVELNGVFVTHALITMHELFLRCAQHYSWYAMRAIYIAKGSPLLPPDFVSMFDDLASSSLDVFFDPSRGLTNLPGLTLGTFKLISKCIGRKGFAGTKRYFGDLGKSLRTAGSNVLFAAVTEISDSVLKGAEASGLNGMVIGFHQGIMKLAMEPSLLGSALMEGGPDRKIKLDRSPGADELYVEGYLQAMLDTLYRQEYLRVRVIDNQVCLKNLPPNNALIEEIMDCVKGFLVSKALLKGDPSRISHPLRHLRGESEWRLGPTLLTLCEHLFVSFAIRMLRKQANKFIVNIKWKKGLDVDNQKSIIPAIENGPEDEQKVMFIWRWGIGRFVLSGIVAYVDGRLCRCIPNPIARRIVSGFLLSFLDRSSDE